MREIGRTSANGQKAYGNDPDNERRPQRVESQRGRESEGRLSVYVIKWRVRREREKLSSRPAAFGSNSVQMKNGDEIIRQAD